MNEKWIKTGFMVLIFVLCVVVLVMTGAETKADAAAYNSPGGALGLTLAKILAAVGVIATIFLVAKNLMNNPKSAMLIGIGFAVMVVIFFIGRGIDAGELYAKHPEVSETVSKNVGGLITLTYTLGLVSALVFIGALVLSIIKK